MTLPTLNGSNYISVQSFTLKAFFPQLTRAFAITGCYSNVAHTHTDTHAKKNNIEKIFGLFFTLNMSFEAVLPDSGAIGYESNGKVLN